MALKDRKSTIQAIGWVRDMEQAKLLDLNPPYQRRSVWNKDYKQFFIDRILRNYPIPPIFVNLEVTKRPTDRRRLAVTVESYLRDCQPRVSVDDLVTMLRNPVHAPIMAQTSLSPAQKVFIILIKEGNLLATAGDLSSLRGDRRYVITSEMLTLYPELKAVPETRRVGFPQT
jgi:hypothetical protein